MEDKRVIGRVYFPSKDYSVNVTVSCPPDEAPQIYLEIPVKFEEDIHKVIRCIWVTEEGVQVLREILDDLQARYDKWKS